MGKHLLLKAVEHNWGLTKCGDWTKTEWRIYYDGSYEIKSSFNLTFDEFEKVMALGKMPKQIEKKTSGIMDREVFINLQSLINQEPWRDPAVNVFACDGVAWEIESYKDDGSIDKTSGDLGYIYGHNTLEAMVSLLPNTENAE